MIFCKNLTEFYQISLKNLPYLTDFSPQLMACMKVGRRKKSVKFCNTSKKYTCEFNCSEVLISTCSINSIYFTCESFT